VRAAAACRSSASSTGARDYGDLRVIIAHDCPKMRNPTQDIYDRCGVHFPELPRWF
jgi:hypothetical protein